MNIILWAKEPIDTTKVIDGDIITVYGKYARLIKITRAIRGQQIE